MIESIQYYTNHFIVEPVESVSATILTPLIDLTNRIALDTILQIAITAPLFYLHYNLFALGFTLGFVLNEQTKGIVDKVNVVYNAQRSVIEKLLLVGIGTPLILITMPTSIVIATLYYSAQWGSILYEDSLQRQPDQQPPGDVQVNPV
jgi:hypothetical protein